MMYYVIKESMLKNGYVGCPILYTNMGLVTGSHRLQALKEINNTGEGYHILNSDLAEDVTDIINYFCEANEISWDEIDFSDLGKIFTGTWVEKYKNEIEEW